jgi:hypothetical protein
MLTILSSPCAANISIAIANHMFVMYKAAPEDKDLAQRMTLTDIKRACTLRRITAQLFIAAASATVKQRIKNGLELITFDLM